MDPKKNVDFLVATLNEQYAQAEKKMALRSSNVESVQELCADIEANFSKLMGLMKTIGADQNHIDQMCKDNSDFDARAKDYMLKTADFCSKTNLNQSKHMSSVNNLSCSSGKSASSVKKQEAFVKLRLAELEAKHASERAKEERHRAEEERRRAEELAQQERERAEQLAEEERNRVQREMQRKIELATVELEAWETLSGDNLNRRYDSFSKLCAKALENQTTNSTKAEDYQISNLSKSTARSKHEAYEGLKEAKISCAGASNLASEPSAVVGISNAYEQPSQILWSNAAGPSNISAQYSQLVIPNEPGPYNNISAHSSTTFSSSAVGFASSSFQPALISSTKVKFQEGPVVGDSYDAFVKSRQTVPIKLSNIRPSSTYVRTELKNRFDNNPTQPKEFRCTFPPPGFSNQNIAFPFAAQNDYNMQENLTPQYNVNSAFNERQLLRNLTPSSTAPLEQSAAIETHIRPSTDAHFRQAFVNEDWLLPRPEFSKFDGDPLKFKTFMNNFERHVETKVGSSKLRLCYLIQHCEKNVQEKIQHFSNKGEQGYSLAKSRLQKEFGRPCVIADVCEKQLKNAIPVKANEPAALKRFAESLEKALIILEEIDYLGSLNSIDTITLLVNKLPFDLRRSWVKESVAIENRTGRVADFRCLVNFVIAKSEELNSLFGTRIHGIKSNPQTFGNTRKSVSSGNIHTKTYSFNVKTKHSPAELEHSTFACFYCKSKSHKLVDCPMFQKAPLSERSNFIKSNKFCYKCLSSRHRTFKCERKNTCNVNGCTGTFHHTLLHPVKQTTKPTSDPSEANKNKSHDSEATQSNAEVTTTCSLLGLNNSSDKIQNSMYLCVVPVKVKYRNKLVKTYAFLDQGSTRSFCDKKLFDILGASGTADEVILQTLTGSKSYQGFNISFTVSALDDNEEYSLSNVLCIPSIPISPNLIPTRKVLNKLAHLRDIEFPQVANATVTLLIGTDSPEIFCTREFRKGCGGQPVAVRTPLGWSLLGPSLSLSVSKNCPVNFVNTDPSLQTDIARLWENDFGCATSVLDTPSSKEDRLVLSLMRKNLTMADGHYVLPLPWRSNLKYPGDSLQMALQRLGSLRKRLLRDDTLHQKYNDVINSYINDNYARLIPADELDVSSLTWTLPHFPVTNPRKPKVRIVYDCAAKHNGIALNDMLMQGPDLVNSLVGVLLRFRKENIALTSDIECMFHQIRVDPKDTHALRFLWWPDGNLFAKPQLYQMLVHLFGATSSPSCAAFVFDKLLTTLVPNLIPKFQKFYALIFTWTTVSILLRPLKEQNSCCSIYLPYYAKVDLI